VTFSLVVFWIDDVIAVRQPRCITIEPRQPLARRRLWMIHGIVLGTGKRTHRKASHERNVIKVQP
jgi:hypothetical protein